jgi:hypothetical protein
MKKTATKKQVVKFDPKLKQLLVPISSVKFWENNPRWNDAAVPKLAKLLQTHTVRSPVVAWSKNKVVYKGNTTLKALRALGCKLIPVLFQDFPSEAAAHAYGVADNKSSEFSEWDEDVLLDLMESKSFSIPVTGFKESEIGNMIDRRDKEIIKDIEHYNMPKLTIMYHPEIKNDLLRYIDKTLVRKFGEKIVIK